MDTHGNCFIVAQLNYIIIYIFPLQLGNIRIYIIFFSPICSNLYIYIIHTLIIKLPLRKPEVKALSEFLLCGLDRLEFV